MELCYTNITKWKNKIGKEIQRKTRKIKVYCVSFYKNIIKFTGAKMSESVKTSSLINCTNQAIMKFPYTTDKNYSDIENYNRTEVLDLLGQMIETFNKLHSDLDTVYSLK
jgi:hypothetical protein